MAAAKRVRRSSLSDTVDDAFGELYDESEASETVRGLQKLLNDTRGKLSDYAAEIAKLKAEKEANSSASAVEELAQQVGLLRSELSSVKKVRDALREENDALEQRLALEDRTPFNKSLEQAKSSIALLERKNKQQDAELMRLYNELEKNKRANRTSLASSSRDIDSEDAYMKAITDALDIPASGNDLLKSVVGKISSMKSDLKSKAQQLKLVQDELADVKSFNADLNTQVQRLPALQKQLQTLRAENANLEREKECLVKEKEALVKIANEAGVPVEEEEAGDAAEGKMRVLHFKRNPFQKKQQQEQASAVEGKNYMLLYERLKAFSRGNLKKFREMVTLLTGFMFDMQPGEDSVITVRSVLAEREDDYLAFRYITETGKLKPISTEYAKQRLDDSLLKYIKEENFPLLLSNLTQYLHSSKD